MKTTIILHKRFRFLFVVLICSILASLAFSCTSHQEEDLDMVKTFKPDDKYFKSTLVSLHFMIESSPVDEVDTLFRQLIEIYDLPVNTSGAKDGTYTGSSPYDAFDASGWSFGSHLLPIQIPIRSNDCSDESIHLTFDAISYPLIT